MCGVRFEAGPVRGGETEAKGGGGKLGGKATESNTHGTAATANTGERTTDQTRPQTGNRTQIDGARRRLSVHDGKYKQLGNYKRCKRRITISNRSIFACFRLFHTDPQTALSCVLARVFSFQKEQSPLPPEDRAVARTRCHLLTCFYN